MKIKEISQHLFLKLLYEGKVPSFIKDRIIKSFMSNTSGSHVDKDFEIFPFMKSLELPYEKETIKYINTEELPLNKDIKSFLKIAAHFKGEWVDNFIERNIPHTVLESEYLDLLITTQNFNKLNSYIKKTPKLQPYFNSYNLEFNHKFGEEVNYDALINRSLYGCLGATDEDGNSVIKNTSCFAYIESFLKYISVESFFEKEKANVLKKLYDDSKFLCEVLSPLKNFHIDYTVDLTGGCVRDFVLNKHKEIKDLDVMVSIQNNILYLTKEIIIKKNIFTKEELEAVNWSDKDDNNTRKIKLLKLCFNRTPNIDKVYSIIDRMHVVGENEYKEKIKKEDRLLAVIKLNNKGINYPIDILLTDFPKYKFLDDFDLNICKASICIKNHFMNLELPSHYAYLLSRFNASVDFWHDVINKKITYNTENRSLKHFITSYGDPRDEEKFKKSHVNRLKNKYPDFQFIVSGEHSHYYADIVTCMKAAQLYSKLVLHPSSEPTSEDIAIENKQKVNMNRNRKRKMKI